MENNNYLEIIINLTIILWLNIFIWYYALQNSRVHRCDEEELIKFMERWQWHQQLLNMQYPRPDHFCCGQKKDPTRMKKTHKDRIREAHNEFLNREKIPPFWIKRRRDRSVHPYGSPGYKYKPTFFERISKKNGKKPWQRGIF